MHRNLVRAMLALFALAPFLAMAQPAAAQPPTFTGKPDAVTLVTTTVNGVTPQATGFEYLSPATRAAHPFTHLLLRREASIPVGAAITLELRASLDGNTWSAWQQVEENDDLWQASDGPDVAWSNTIAVGATALFWQVRASYSAAPDGARPLLRQIQVNTIDAGAFSATAAMRTAATPTKPAVVSRVAWGNPDGQWSRVAPDYYPVNHMVVHHTADSNSLYPSEPNWAARVRAEWSFHTFTRGWGDVGYNYLIDPDGVIYEGRAGGDDAVAFHDRANYGSMGVVLIGTYTDVAPQPAAQDALVRLLAWKAGQKGIDPLGRSYYYGCTLSPDCRAVNPGAVVVNIAGHRNVLGAGTTCPGDRAAELLPSIRNRVKAALSGGPSDNGDLEVDELESSFTHSAANWYDTTCGTGGHSYYTFTTDTPAESTNHATWIPPISQAGVYHVYAAIPRGCGPPNQRSAQASYVITHGGGTTTKVIDQGASDGWVDLGTYSFGPGAASVALDDLTGEPYAQQRVLFFDSIKWVPEDTTASVEISNVTFDKSTVAAGELLKVTFSVRNTGQTTLYGQAPHVDLSAGDGQGDVANGYVYEQGECFAGALDGQTPGFPKETNRFRLTLGYTGWDAANGATCDNVTTANPSGSTSDYPWRWGFNADLAPGKSQTIIGYVRFTRPGSYSLRANLVQEYVRYFYDTPAGVAAKTITVVPERGAPALAQYDDRLQPMAQVYRLGSIPDNFLARTTDATAIPRGAAVGSFAWDGSLIDWGNGGPLGQTDRFIIEQTRTFLVPVSGRYTFRTLSDDGSWLWIDGRAVVINQGMHQLAEATGTIDLTAGVHTVAFKSFERNGTAAASYGMMPPGATGFGVLTDGLGSGALQLGNVFTDFPTLTLAADDLGGDGVGSISWSWDGANWQERSGGLLNLGRLQNSTYHLRYRATDANGNQAAQRDLVFTVDTDVSVSRLYFPVTTLIAGQE